MDNRAHFGNQGGLTELKNRLLFVLAALVIYRIGAHITVPGLSQEKLAELFSGHTSFLGLFNLFSGGALQRVTIFSLGIMPYISASIIMQLLTIAWPSLEQLKKEGQRGKQKLTQYTRYLTIVLGTVQAIGMASLFASDQASVTPIYYVVITTSLVAGTMFLVWLGEQITERGVGNGISMLIFAGIVANLPRSIANTMEKVNQGEMHAISLFALLAMLLIVISIVVFIERGQRRITVHYAKRMQGRKMFAAQKSHLPLKINMAGVIPPIFASSIILMPATIGQWFGKSTSMEWLAELSLAITPGHPLYVIIFAFAIVAFCFIYTALVFNPKETADNLKKSGAFLPGIRPGEQTANYIDKVMTRLTLVGAIYITTISLMPEFLVLFMNVPFYFGGTSLLIVVVVVMDFIAQVQAHLMSHQYEGLMKKAKLKT